MCDACERGLRRLQEVVKPDDVYELTFQLMTDQLSFTINALERIGDDDDFLMQNKHSISNLQYLVDCFMHAKQIEIELDSRH